MSRDPDDAPPLRLMQFVSQDQLDEAKKSRGLRVDDGSAHTDKPLYEILKENKDKRDAEFNERFKHRPPKALDEDETEFLDKLETSKRELERQMEDEEARQLRSFQEAVANRSSVVYEVKKTLTASMAEERKAVSGNRNQTARPLGGMFISVRPQAKKLKTERSVGKTDCAEDISDSNGDKLPVLTNGSAIGLVSYSDESEDDS